MISCKNRQALKALWKNKIKDLRLNAHVKHFTKHYSRNVSIPRENFFLPEVVIPCYNHGQFLLQALSSIAPQIAINSMKARIPVTVINDASTDDSKVIAEQLQQRFGFKLIHNEVNLNQGGSLNRAIAESDNNLFIILNADDFLLKFCIPTVINLFEYYPTIRMAGGSCIPFSNQQLLSINDRIPETLGYVPFARIYKPSEACFYKRMNDLNMTMSSCTFLKSAWQAVDGFWEFEQRICSMDDRDFQIRVSALFDVAVIEEPLCMYRKISSLGRAQFVSSNPSVIIR